MIFSRFSVKAVLRTLAGDTRGATAIEYGLIMALIVIGLVSAVGGLGNVSSGMWNNTTAKIDAVVPK